MNRKEAIENLKEKRHELIEFWEDYKHENHEVQALDIAIASLETDEAYQLMEEEPEFCKNCVSREAVLKLIYDYKESHIENREEHPINYGTLCDMIRWVRELPSVLPKADKLTIIDWNNCHTPEQLDSIATTKNDLGVDCISRGQALKELKESANHHANDSREEVLLRRDRDIIRALPSVTPIRPKGHWISHGEHCKNLGVIPSGLGAYEWCSNCDCGIDVREWYMNHYNYCPNCGADMRTSEE